MNKDVKHAISQTKDYACSSEFGKDFAKNAALTGIGLLAGRFILNLLDIALNNITSETK